MNTVVAKPLTNLVKLKSRDEVAEHTVAFHFEKPDGFTFIPGQFIDVTLLAPPETDADGNTRGFSIASAPFETKLMVTTRLRDTAFKRVLQTMPLGSEVKIDGPFGDLKLHNDVKRTAVFLAGGIGSRRSAAFCWMLQNKNCLIVFFSSTPIAGPRTQHSSMNCRLSRSGSLTTHL